MIAEKCIFCDQKFHPNMTRHYCPQMITFLLDNLVEIRNKTARPGGNAIITRIVDNVFEKTRTVKGYADI